MKEILLKNVEVSEKSPLSVVSLFNILDAKNRWEDGLSLCERLLRFAPRQKFYFLGLKAPHERPDEMVTRTDWPLYPIL